MTLSDAQRAARARIEEALVANMKQRSLLRWKLEQANEERDRLFAEGKDLGVPVARMARAVGVTRKSAYEYIARGSAEIETEEA